MRITRSDRERTASRTTTMRDHGPTTMCDYGRTTVGPRAEHDDGEPADAPHARRGARADRGRPVLLSRQRLYQLAVLMYH